MQAPWQAASSASTTSSSCTWFGSCCSASYATSCCSSADILPIGASSSPSPSSSTCLWGMGMSPHPCTISRRVGGRGWVPSLTVLMRLSRTGRAEDVSGGGGNLGDLFFPKGYTGQVGLELPLEEGALENSSSMRLCRAGKICPLCTSVSPLCRV